MSEANPPPEDDDEGSGRRRSGSRGTPRRQPARSYTVPIADLDLTTVEGQEKLIIRCQEALAGASLNALDLKIIIALKDSVKIKKDIDTLKMYVELKTDIEKLKEEKRKSKSIASTDLAQI